MSPASVPLLEIFLQSNHARTAGGCPLNEARQTTNLAPQHGPFTGHGSFSHVGLGDQAVSLFQPWSWHLASSCEEKAWDSEDNYLSGWNKGLTFGHNLLVKSLAFPWHLAPSKVHLVDYDITNCFDYPYKPKRPNELTNTMNTRPS